MWTPPEKDLVWLTCDITPTLSAGRFSMPIRIRTGFTTAGEGVLNVFKFPLLHTNKVQKVFIIERGIEHPAVCKVAENPQFPLGGSKSILIECPLAPDFATRLLVSPMLLMRGEIEGTVRQGFTFDRMEVLKPWPDPHVRQLFDAYKRFAFSVAMQVVNTRDLDLGDQQRKSIDKIFSLVAAEPIGKAAPRDRSRHLRLEFKNLTELVAMQPETYDVAYRFHVPLPPYSKVPPSIDLL